MIHKQIVYMLAADDDVLPPEVTGLAAGHVILGLGPVLHPSWSGSR